MIESNPYESPVAVGEPTFQGGWKTVAGKILLCGLGLALFASNPWRDLWFYRDIAAHEGFGTTNDAYIIGFAGQLLATVVFFPLAISLIGYGILNCTRLSLVPRFDRFTWSWSTLATLAALFMLWIEGDYLLYGLTLPHHWDTCLLSLAYLGFIYIWWCCSLAHRPTSRW